MEYQNQNEALNEYLERAYVEPCKALYEMLSEHSKDAYDFWQVIVPNWKTFAVNGTLTMAVAAFGYSAIQAQSVMAEEDILVTNEPTSTPTNVVTLQPWKTLTPTETGTPDLTVTATFATPVFITLVPTRTPTSAPTVTVTLTPVSDDENNLYLPIAEKS
jgi:hypothetical protein